MNKLYSVALIVSLCSSPVIGQRRTARRIPTQKSQTKQSPRHPKFNKPEIDNIVVDMGCKTLLLQQSDKLQAAGYAKKLLAWEPLIDLATEDNPPFAAFSILTTNWDDLATGMVNVDKIVFSVLASESYIHAATHDSDPTLKKFWQAMGDYYGSLIPTPSYSSYVIGTWKGSQSTGTNSIPFTLAFQQNGNLTSCQFSAQSSTRPCKNLKIESDGSIAFTIASTNFTGKIIMGAGTMNGKWIAQVYTNTWNAKKQ